MQTLNELLALQDNDYSHLEQDYYHRTQSALVGDPYDSVRHQLTEVTLSVSVVIPAYNAAATLLQCLISLEQSTFNQKYPHLLEVIVVDDGSRDMTWQLLERTQVQLNLKAVRQTNRGCGQARNTGVAVSQGDIVLCCDADMVLLPFTIEELVKRHQLLDRVLLIGFRTYIDIANPRMQVEGLPQHLKTFLPTFFGDVRLFYVAGWNLCRETEHLKRLGHGKYIIRPNGTWRTLPHQVHGALFSIRRREYLAIGGCDEQFQGWGYEDTLFAAQAIARGNYVLPVYSAAGLHLTPSDLLPTSSRRVHPQELRHWQEGAANALSYRQKLCSPLSSPQNEWLNRVCERIECTRERSASSTRKSREVDPQYYESYTALMAKPYLRGLYYFQLGRWDEAIEAFGQVQGTVKEEADAQWLCGKALRLSGQTEAAISTFRDVISSSPLNPDTYIEYALALARQSRFEDAKKQLYRANEMSTDHPLLHWLLKGAVIEDYGTYADLYLRQGDSSLAVQEYDKALLAQPSRLMTQVKRACVLAASGAEEVATRARDTYLAQVPSPAARTTLLKVWEMVEQGEYGRGKVFLERYLRTHPEESWPRDLLGEIHDVVAQEASLPLARTLLQAVRALPGPLNEAELNYLITLTLQCLARMADDTSGMLIDSNGYCGQATIALGLTARKVQADHIRLFSIYQPGDEPVALDDSALRCMLSRDFLQLQLWKHQLTENVTCLPEQGTLPTARTCHLLLLQGSQFPRQANEYASLLAAEGLLLVHPYSDEREDVQQWVDGLLQSASYTFLGQVDSLIALKANHVSDHTSADLRSRTR